MPVCVVCKSVLPPDYLVLTEDALAKKCIFCTRGTDTIEYFSESEGTQKKTTKSEAIREYVEFLKEVSSIPNVADILDAIKDKKSGIILT
jgi:hypothetical protein